MSNSWSHIRLGDACDIINGRNQKAVEDPSGVFPIYGSGGIMGYANTYLCKGGSTIIGRKGTINRPLYVDIDFWNVDTAFGLSPKAGIAPRFLFYLCKSINWLKYNKSTTLPSLVKSDLLQIPISVPGIEEQQRIVDELDLLTGVIDKKNAQLRDLDALAQSIFYEMFGDPESSAFPVQSLRELSTANLSYGSGASAVPFDGNIRYIRITDIVSPSIFDAKYLLHEGDILFARSGATVGKTYLYHSSDGSAIFAGYLIRVVPDTNIVLPEYLFNFTKTGFYKRFIGLNAQAVAQPNINAKQYGSLKVVVPPIDLQHAFATKIEAIEQQKALIKQSLQDTQTLLASRMDHYFGE